MAGPGHFLFLKQVFAAKHLGGVPGGRRTGIEIGTGGQKPAYHGIFALEQGTGNWRLVADVTDVWIGTAFQQHHHGFFMAVVSREHQQGIAVQIEHVHVQSVVEKFRQFICLAFAGQIHGKPDNACGLFFIEWDFVRHGSSVGEDAAFDR